MGLDNSLVTQCRVHDCSWAKYRVSVPIDIHDNVAGYVVGCSDNEGTPDRMAIDTRLVSNIIASKAYSEFELNSLSVEILDKYEEINLLYDIGETLGAVFDADTIYQIVLEKVTEVIGAQQAWIMILSKDEESLHLAAAKGLSPAEMATLSVKVGEGISGKVAKEGSPLLIEDAGQLPLDWLQREDISDGGPVISFPLLCVPLKVKDQVLGVINLVQKRSHEMFTAGDVKLLSAIASQAAISIHNCQLIEELKESERAKRDMEIAARIQMSLLPAEPPGFRGMELAGRCIPAKNIGGDYYDFFVISEDELGIVIADVSGHSVGAALVMAATRSVLRSEVLRNSSPSAILARTSTIMHQDLVTAELFITMFYVHYDRKTAVLRYANGGHNLPFIYRANDGQCTTIDADGMLLGVLDGIHFGQGRVRLNIGDILVLYTDGVTETVNSAAEQFGEERLYQIVQQNSKMTAQGLLDEIYRQVYQYNEDLTQYDDITALVIKVKEGVK